MMKDKYRKLTNKLNEDFKPEIDEAFQKQFGIELVTEWNLISMGLVSYRKDEKKLTKEQKYFIYGYSAGYSRAMDKVRWEGTDNK